MSLVLSEGIKDVREIENATLILKVYEKLKPIATVIKINTSTMLGYVDQTRREEKRFYSILQEQYLVDRLKGLLSIEKEAQLIEMKINKLEREKEPDDAEKMQLGKLKEVYNKLRQNLTEQIADLKNLQKINEAYQKIKYGEEE